MSETITYISNGTPIRAELFTPPGKPRGAGVVIAHGSDGVTDNLNGPWAEMMRDYGSALSDAGFTVLLPHYFEKTGTAPGAPAMLAMLMHLQAWQEALGDAVAHLETLSGVTPGRIALLGFSLGGHLSLRLRDRVPVLVEFFAPYLTGLGTAPSTAPHVQIHHGAGDRLVDFANAEQISEALRNEGVRTDPYRYEGAGHGFKGSDPKNAEARSLSKERTLEFVAAHL